MAAEIATPNLGSGGGAVPGFQRNNSIDPTTLGFTRQQRALRGGRRSFTVSNNNNDSGLTGGTSNHTNGTNNTSFSSDNNDSFVSTKWSHESVKFSAKNFVDQKSGTLESYYRLGELVGEGGFGEVYACTHAETGERRAVKVMEKSTRKQKINDDIIKEYNILRELDHPNILKVYEMYETKSHFFIVTDLYEGGDLFSELEDCGCFTENDAAQLLNTILSCMNYCHSRNLVHLDLKPENILLTGRSKGDYSSIKIIDFGLAQYQETNEKLTLLEGSSYYMSPQVVQKCYTGSKADVWSCGVICHVLLTGFAPFDAPTYEGILKAIVKGEFDFDVEEWEDMSVEVMDFISFCLTYDEDERPSAKEALMHPFLKKSRRRGGGRRGSMERRNSARDSLKDLQNFASGHSKLKQATCAIVASQLLSQEEKDEIDDVFRSLDISCDGELDKDDLRRAYKEYFDVELSDKEVDKLFSEVNISGSGAIQYSEFAIAVMMSKNMVDEQKLRAAFKIFDKDGKGHISSDDIKRVLHLDDEHDEYLRKKILRQVDAEDSGKIDYDQFSFIMLSSAPITKTKRRGTMKKQVSIRRTPRRSFLSASKSEVKLDPEEVLNASLLESNAACWFGDDNSSIASNALSVASYPSKSLKTSSEKEGLAELQEHDNEDASSNLDLDLDSSSSSSYEEEIHLTS